MTKSEIVVPFCSQYSSSIEKNSNSQKMNEFRYAVEQYCLCGALIPAYNNTT